MALPQLEYAPTSQNQRVQGFEVPGDEQPRRFTRRRGLDDGEADEIIRAAYRQVFNEQQMLTSNRLPWLESQLKSGQITVRGFIQGLVTSATFRERNYEANNNYRFVRMGVQRLLGREVYSDREVMSWSIVLATKGLHGFVNDLLNSAEYLDNFGENTVPYQRRRILPQRSEGAVTFAHMPRYGDDFRDQLTALGHHFHQTGGAGAARWAWQKAPYPDSVQRVGAAIAIFGASFLGLLVLGTVLSWFGWVHI